MGPIFNESEMFAADKDFCSGFQMVRTKFTHDSQDELCEFCGRSAEEASAVSKDQSRNSHIRLSEGHENNVIPSSRARSNMVDKAAAITEI